jgi:hypothetical protein
VGVEGGLALALATHVDGLLRLWAHVLVTTWVVGLRGPAIAVRLLVLVLILVVWLLHNV